MFNWTGYGLILSKEEFVMSAKVVSSVPFHGTKEQKEALDAVIAQATKVSRAA